MTNLVVNVSKNSNFFVYTWRLVRFLSNFLSQCSHIKELFISLALLFVSSKAPLPLVLKAF